MAHRIALVTGATQGLGHAVVRGLAERLSPADIVLLTSRDPDRVGAAVAALGGTSARVEGRGLDVGDPAAIERAAADIAGTYGGIDIVVSNASSRMSPERSPAEQVDAVARINNLGTTRMLRAFGPLLRPGGRFLVVASSFGTLGHLDPAVRPVVDAIGTLDEADAVLDSWRRAVHDGTATAQGWPRWLNVPSKVLQVAAVRALAAERRDTDLAGGTLLAAVCPGLIDTGASRPWFEDMSQAQTPDEAAVALLDLITSPVDPTAYGELVRHGTVLPWRAEVAPEARPGVRASRVD